MVFTETPQLRAFKVRQLAKVALRIEEIPGPAVARIEANAYPNRFTPKGQPRWMADCPRPCGGAEVVSPDSPFLCGSCGATCAVVWPAERDDIEAVLAARPDPMTRNWSPGETVRDLIAENRAHGIR
jgi:hypothetical protein